MDIQGLTGGASSRNAYLTLNSTTGTSVFMYGGPSTQVSGTDGGDAQLPFGSGRNICIVNIMDYSATDKHKTILQRTGQDYNVVWANASRVAITSAVTSVSCVGSDSGSDQFIAGCTFSLYGIAA
jgi:hypothetical protein